MLRMDSPLSHSGMFGVGVWFDKLRVRGGMFQFSIDGYIKIGEWEGGGERDGGVEKLCRYSSVAINRRRIPTAEPLTFMITCYITCLSTVGIRRWAGI
jgi:hypothetical protein